jgi:hypothetical protein
VLYLAVCTCDAYNDRRYRFEGSLATRVLGAQLDYSRGCLRHFGGLCFGIGCVCDFGVSLAPCCVNKMTRCNLMCLCLSSFPLDGPTFRPRDFQGHLLQPNLFVSEDHSLTS